MNKRRYDSDLAKEIIAEKAIELFSLKGYTRTSIDNIAKASGYSKGHIYYHYKNKEELFVYLAKDSMKNWHDKWEIAENSIQTQLKNYMEWLNLYFIITKRRY